MRRLLVPVLAGLVLAGCGQRPAETGALPGTTATTTSEAPVTSQSPQLSPHGKDVLEQVRRSGAKTVVLVLATERDKTDQVADGVRRLGATVEATDTAIGYVRASVPVELAEQVTAVDGVSHVDVDEPLSNIDPTP